jgi:malate synthase
MTVPFMRAYTELLVKTCHRAARTRWAGWPRSSPAGATQGERGRPRASAGGQDPRIQDGFDGTWVAHPDLVPIAREPFARLLGDRAHQLERQRPEVAADAAALLDVRIPSGASPRRGSGTT